jgi:oxygen-independent coproporphyrinogen-3 oxidase
MYDYDLLKNYEGYLTKLEQEGKVNVHNGILTLTHSGKLLADRIASDLFVLSE